MVKKNLFKGVLFVSILFTGCVEMTEEGCERGKKNVGEFSMAIVLTEKPYKPYNYILKGIDLNTGKDTVYKYEGRWFDQLGGYWNTGDTIIKKEGELFLEIRKKDVIHTSEWTCEGVFIDGVSVRDLGRIQKYGK